MEEAKPLHFRQGDARGRDRGMDREDGDRFDSRRGYGRDEDRGRGRDPVKREFDQDSGRRSERSPSPLPDFGDKTIRWSGWDKPVARYGSAVVSGGGGWSGGGHFGGAAPDSFSEPSMRGDPGSVIPRQQKRLYVGNLPSRLVEPHFIDFLNQSMRKIPGVVAGEGNPVIGIDMSSERTYCFIEFRSPDEATYFTAFDGLTYEGHSLRIHRPREWMPTGREPALPQIPPSALGIVSTTVADGPNKIFIGGLPTHFNEAEVKEILTALGALKSFNLVRDNNGNSKGFAFCEYVDPDVTDLVCQSFNGRRYGDRTLVVQRSQPGNKGSYGENNPAAASGASGEENGGRHFRGPHDAHTASSSGPGGYIGMTSRVPSMTTGTDGVMVLAPEEIGGLNNMADHMLNSSVPTDVLTNTIVAKAREQLEALQPTNILVLVNALDITEEWTDDYYNAVCQDFWTEGSKHGELVRLVVPRAPPRPKRRKMLLMPGELSESDIGADGRLDRDQKDSNPPNPPGYGRIYIEYKSVDQARAALSAMAGRKYDGRMLLSSFVKSIPDAQTVKSEI